MALTELYSFGKDLSIFDNCKKGITRYGIITEAQLHNSLITFQTSFDLFCTTVLKGKKYAERSLADYIFTSNFKSINQYQEYLKRSLFIAQQYLSNFVSKINSANIEKYKDGLHVMRIDFEWLLTQIELHIIKSTKKIMMHSGRNKHKDPFSIFSVASTLFNIEDLKKLDDLYIYDLKPYSVFAIRQLIEIYGKNLLGFHSVIDANGNFSKKHLYSAWAFIKEELKKPKPRISIPFDIEIILKIEKWSNRFVHTAYHADCYIIWKALQMLKPLFIPITTPIKIYNGKNQRKFFIPEIKIQRYSTLKASFTKYVNKGAKAKGQYKVVWLNIENVGAYIISR